MNNLADHPYLKYNKKDKFDDCIYTAISKRPKLYCLCWYNLEQPDIKGSTGHVPDRDKVVQTMRKLVPFFPEQFFFIEVRYA
jgi:hypothetical protein